MARVKRSVNAKKKRRTVLEQASGYRGQRSRLSQSHAWVFGNEARGLSGDEMRLCDALVSIPMTGDAESLNVASAAATCLFASQTVRGVEN